MSDNIKITKRAVIIFCRICGENITSQKGSVSVNKKHVKDSNATLLVTERIRTIICPCCKRDNEIERYYHAIRVSEG